MGWLISGGGRVNLHTPFWKNPLRVVRGGAAMRLLRAAEPGPVWVTRSRGVTSFRTSASLAARSTSWVGRVAARSRRVRMGEVTGRPWRLVVGSVVAWWKRRPGRLRGALFVVVA